jgi:two-component system chemotaxis response regulator CheB
MQTRDIVVVGASAGGITALKEFVKFLPKDFKGSVFVVLHIPAYTETYLPTILSKAGPLKAIIPKDGETIEAGMIYVAPNDHHMLLEHNKVIVRRGPKENRFRPSIDALFRSAAYVYGPRVIGVVLSGFLDDGTSGLWTIKRLGGIAIIQDPHDAEQPQMPENVLGHVEVDYTLTAVDMGPLITGLVSEASPEKFKLSDQEMELLKKEIIIATRDNAFEMGIIDMGEFTPLTCPECHGALVRLVEGNIIRFRCHTGHAYTASSLLADVSTSVEDLLWQSMRAMEEMVILLNNTADQYEKLGNRDTAALFRRKAKNSSKRARIIHDSIFSHEQYSEDLRFKHEGTDN